MVVNGSWILNIILKVEPVRFDMVCEGEKGIMDDSRFFCFSNWKNRVVAY